MSGAPLGYRPKVPSQGTAETLILVAFILQTIISAIWIALLGILGLAFGSFFFLLGAFAAAVIAVLALAVLLVVVMLFVAYQYSYRRVKDGDLAGSRGPTLLLGIVGIFTGFLVVGILYIIAYVVIGHAEDEVRSMGYAAGAPGGYANPNPGAYAARVPNYGAVAYAPPPLATTMTCPRCGRPGTFIPQYGRSYCYSCAQYL
jgi:hypothetical protein